MVRFQCERCGRHYAVSEALRGRSFRLKCRICGETIVVRPETVPGENPFLVDPVTASAASVAASRADGAVPRTGPVDASPAEPVTVSPGMVEGTGTVSPGAAGPGLVEPAAGAGEPATPGKSAAVSPPADRPDAVPRPAGPPPGHPAAGAIPVLPWASGRTSEPAIRKDWFAGEALESPGGLDEGRGRRDSPAVEELRRALAEALDEAAGSRERGEGGPPVPGETLSDEPLADQPASGGPPASAAAGTAVEGTAAGRAAAAGPGAAGTATGGAVAVGTAAEGTAAAGTTAEGTAAAGTTAAGTAAGASTEEGTAAGGDGADRDGSWRGAEPRGPAETRVSPRPVPAPPLFREAVRPTSGPALAIAVAAVAVAAIVAGVLAVRPEALPGRLRGAGTTAPAPDEPGATRSGGRPTSGGAPALTGTPAPGAEDASTPKSGQASAAAGGIPVPVPAGSPPAVAPALAGPVASPPPRSEATAAPAAAPSPRSAAPGPQAAAGPQAAPGPQAAAGPRAAPGPQAAPGQQAAPGPPPVPDPPAAAPPSSRGSAASPVDEPPPEVRPPTATPPSTAAGTPSAPPSPPGAASPPEASASGARPPLTAPAPGARPPPARPLRRTPPTAEEVARAAAAVREAFDACFAAAPAPVAGARAPSLLATVEPSGEVTFATLDDLELARSSLGACIKEAARTMSFAPFEGKPVPIDVPLARPVPR